MIRLKTARLILLAAPAVLLSACNGDEDKAQDERTASGQVLEGTISDAMLPLETVTSQPPFVKDQPKPAASDAAEGEEGEESEGGGRAQGPGDAPPIAGEGAAAQ